MPVPSAPSSPPLGRPFVPRRAARAFDRERVQRAVERIRRQEGFATTAEAQLHVSRFAGRRVEDLQEAAGHDPREDAQELAFRALESRGADAAALARQALALDRRSVDARCALAREQPLPEREAALRAALSDADSWQDLAGGETLRDLWNHLDARPVLRARTALAQCLEDMGRLAEAAQQWEERLSLDLPDAQNCRFDLARCYFALGRLKPLRALLDTYRQDQGAMLAWARALERFRAHAGLRAAQQLKKARAANPHVEGYLTGRLRMPRTLPDMGAPGSLEEAQKVMACLGPAWTSDLEAMAWLRAAG